MMIKGNMRPVDGRLIRTLIKTPPFRREQVLAARALIAWGVVVWLLAMYLVFKGAI